MLVGSERPSDGIDGHASPPGNPSAVRWLEYSGVLVILALLADTAYEGLPVTGLVDFTNLCNETVYSALAVAVGLGLVQSKVFGRRVPIVKRYYLTEAGRRLGVIAQLARDEMSMLPPPPRRRTSRRPPDARGAPWESQV